MGAGILLVVFLFWAWRLGALETWRLDSLAPWRYKVGVHLSVFLPEPAPVAKLWLYTQLADGTWDEDAWFAPTLDQVAEVAGMDLGPMNEAYGELVALGIVEVSLTSYTRGGMDTNDPAEAGLWQANVRHPENSGMGHTGKGRTVAAAILDAARIESERQEHGLRSSLAYHEQEAEKLRALLLEKTS